MRNRRHNRSGFSLTEVLLAVGTLAVGMIFVAGVFPVAIHFTTIATERTIAAVVADEAFAKVKIYGVDLTNPALGTDHQTPFEIVTLRIPASPAEYEYPSTDDVVQRQYCWSALCRPLAVGQPGPFGSPTDKRVQVTVFVSRRTGTNADRPMAFPVHPSGSVGSNLLTIADPDERRFVNDGSTIVDDQTGKIYRVLERQPHPNDNLILLDRVWEGPGAPVQVWVVPPPENGGRYPCIGVYQKVIEF
ncbi:MAG: type IV pilus modification PilV family protein [Planctomycetota bacterium]|jgi:hypothetical protein